MNMNRRNFIKSSIAAAAACYGVKGVAAVNAVSAGNRIGVQLYSINKELPADIDGSLKKLADIGYSNVEAYGFDSKAFLGKPLKEWTKILADKGLKLSGTHCGTPLLPDDINATEWDYWRKSIDEINAAGAKLLIQSFLPSANSVSDLKRVAEQFNRIGELCNINGVKFGYHNHNAEFNTLDGAVILDVLVRSTDPGLVFFQMDLGHVVNGGGDIMAYIRRYPRRFRSWHASDFKKGQGYTETGKGDVPYEELFKRAEANGLMDLTVEQETGGDIFGALKNDFDFLSQYPWTQA